MLCIDDVTHFRPSKVGGGVEGPKAAMTSPSPSTRHYRCPLSSVRQYFSPGPSTSTDLAPVVAETPGGRPERGDTLQAPRIRLRQQTDGPVADQPYITAHTHTVNTSRFFFSFLCFCWCNYTGTCGGCLRLGGTK
ncbi:hypothetical protein Pcinc_039318 [Petrolisthes cinctipes]|uniref:Uncharacterized protein n=1 Tax=Petrolisthes cinctipes TaxID=88211 RepID=A0AAE1EJ74_PETCI|nr:hypothetical protein Pcinc_039318 [Petrolisthes cinctipes]